MAQVNLGRSTLAIISRIATGLFIIALPVAIVTTNVRILAGSEWFYERGFREYDADVATGLSLAQLDAAGERIRDYFADGSERLDITVVEDGVPVPLFSAEEVEHMVDVKGLVRAVYRANELAWALVVAYVAFTVLWRREHTFRALAWHSIAGVGVGLAVVAVVGGVALVGGFDAAWNDFHELVFTNDLWRLDPDEDRLIQMFPEPFWEEATLIVALASIVESAVVVIAAAAYLLWAPRTEGEAESERQLSPAEGPSA